MENNNKYKKIIITLSVILVVLLLAFGGLYLYRKFVVLKGIDRTNVPIQHGSVDNNKKEEKVTLDEEDVKKWLDMEDISIFISYFTEHQVDYDYENATSKDYSKIVAQYMINSNAGENIYYNDELGTNEKKYNKKNIYAYLSDIFNVGIEKLDLKLMEYYGNNEEFLEDENNYIVKYESQESMTGVEAKYKNIKLNNNNFIVITYEINYIWPSVDAGKNYGQREIVLKKTDNGYNILKAYKVES